MFSGYSQNFWVNLIGFNIAWWSAILLRQDAVVILGLLLTAHIAGHRQPWQEGRALVVCGLLGFMVDLLLTRLGLFRFAGSEWPPLWLLLLWFCFAATLRQSLCFFRSRLRLAAVCGAVSGSLTYLAAARLGAVTLEASELAMFGGLAVIWLGLFPLLLKLSHPGFREVRGNAF